MITIDYMRIMRFVVTAITVISLLTMSLILETAAFFINAIFSLPEFVGEVISEVREIRWKLFYRRQPLLLTMRVDQ